MNVYEFHITTTDGVVHHQNVMSTDETKARRKAKRKLYSLGYKDCDFLEVWLLEVKKVN